MIEKAFERGPLGVFKDDWKTGLYLLVGAIAIHLLWRFLRNYMTEDRLLLMALSMSTMAFALGVLLCGKYLHHRRMILWMISKGNFDRSHDIKGGSQVADEPSHLKQRDPWPWGFHHTELLGHLDAAAKKFWINYDPDDFGSAPTNRMVAEWLQIERKVSKDKAEAIASILRADGLPTGPRR